MSNQATKSEAAKPSVHLSNIKNFLISMVNGTADEELLGCFYGLDWGPEYDGRRFSLWVPNNPDISRAEIVKAIRKRTRHHFEEDAMAHDECEAWDYVPSKTIVDRPGMFRTYPEDPNYSVHLVPVEEES